MKILPIQNNNYQSQNISSKGYVSNEIKHTLRNYAPQYNDVLNKKKKKKDKYPLRIKTFEGYKKDAAQYAENLIKNLETIMSRFGKSCVLNWYSSKINPAVKRFVIESKDSNYKHICGDVTIKNMDYGDDFTAIDNFSRSNLAKINPYETNLKFMQMYAPKSITDADNFSAEKDIWFISEELIPAKPSYKNEGDMSWEDIKKYTQDLQKENDEFKKDFCCTIG